MLKALGHELTLSAYSGIEGGTLRTEDYLILPPGRKAYGNDIIAAHVQNIKPDVVISLLDVWVLRADFGEKCEGNWYPWVPIDHEPLVPLVKTCLSTAKEVIAMSEFGANVLRAGEVPRVTFIPHSFDPGIYQPYNVERFRWRKQVLGLAPEDFVVGIVAANHGIPSRKAFWENIQAFGRLAREHDNVYLYLHTEIDQADDYHNADIRYYLEQAGIPEGRLRFADGYGLWLGYGTAYMGGMYNGLDGLLFASMGEGFGVPLIEAGGCGVPSIVTNFSAQPELIQHQVTGYIADVAIETIMHSPPNAKQVIPSVDSIYEGLRWLYENAKDPVTREITAETARARWSSPVVQEQYWKPFLERIAETKHAMTNAFA